MDGNKDEAVRCLAIAQKHFDANNLPSARKFCLKSIALFETPQATRLLASINKAAASSNRNDNGESSPSVSNSQTEEHPSAAGMKHRHAQPKSTGNGTAGGMGGEKREYTPEQESIVKRVRRCKMTDYYEILSVKKECEEVEIKKAYRKVCYATLSMLRWTDALTRSSLWLCILTRTAHLGQMRHLSVSATRYARQATYTFTGKFSGIQGIPSAIRYITVVE